MPTQVPQRHAKPRASRASLACVPCRTRHIRCDATRPYCHRCSSQEIECFYEKSRRGGLTREALADRQSRKTGDAVFSGPSSLAGTEYRGETRAPEQGDSRMEAWDTRPATRGNSSAEQRETPTPPIQAPPAFDTRGALHLSAGIGADPLIDLYYEHFHGFHPCVLPQRHLQGFLRDPTWEDALGPLVSVMRFIGSIYGSSSESPELKKHARACNSDSQLPMNSSTRAFLAQSRLLLSIALYWSTDMEESRSVLDRAIRDALDLGMNCQEFAATNGGGDPILEESWRRTWWQIYTVDAYYAAIKRSTKFLAQEMVSTVDLPCEESEYDTGSIPKPRSLEDFENREFSLDDHVYSSFAYLVGAIRCIASATAAAPEKTSTSSSAKVVEAVDAIVDGWFLLLPESKRQVMGKNGTVDELIFQAHMGLHAAIVGLHRPYSNLIFNPLEIISSCSTGPPDSVLVGDLVNVHTIRCLKSVEAQIRLMALPARPFCHTPFVICMMTAGTIPLLSACKFHFAAERIEIARHQIRMSIGCLRAMAGIWPQAAVHVRELQTIAQDVLGISSTPSGGLNTVNYNGAGRSRTGSLTNVGHFDTELDGSFLSDSMGDDFQQAWDSIQPDLAVYDLATFN